MAKESLSELQSAFGVWRRSKKNPRDRIPDALLARARGAVAVHGIGPVAYRLRVAVGRLTPRVARKVVRAAAVTPTFTRVEIAAPPSTTQPMAEVETPAGVKLRIFQVTSETTSLLSSFCLAGGAV